MSVTESLGISSTTFTQCAPKDTEFGEITQNKGQSKAHNKFVLVINTNLSPILHRFRDIACDSVQTRVPKCLGSKVSVSGKDYFNLTLYGVAWSLCNS